MVGPLQSKHDAIAAACARHSVLRLEAFGSVLRDDFVPGQSDVDLLVEFEFLESYALVVPSLEGGLQCHSLARRRT